MGIDLHEGLAAILEEDGLRWMLMMMDYPGMC